MTTVKGEPGYIGIDKTLALISATEKLVVDGAGLLKVWPPSLFSVGKVITVVNDLKSVVAEAQGVLPELKDLDADETAQLGEAAYKAVANMVTTLTGLGLKLP